MTMKIEPIDFGLSGPSNRNIRRRLRYRQRKIESDFEQISGINIALLELESDDKRNENEG